MALWAGTRWANNETRVAIAAALMTTMLASAAATPSARAQDAGSARDRQPAVGLAQLSAERAFDIPAQPLTTALTLFGQQAGLQITVHGTLPRGTRAPGIRGTMTSEAALSRLLAGSGLVYVVEGDSTVAIEKPGQGGADGATMLGPVTVEGTAESPYGPVDGYVATRSATGTKTDTPLIETPQSISVITRDQMDARAVRDIGETVQYTAGVRSNLQGESSGLGGSSISIRGFGGNGTAGASFSEYVDGLRIGGTNFAVAGFEPYLFERIEVLKGPSSVLYGQSTPAGVVNHVSKRPPVEPLREIRVGGGSFDRKEGAFDLGGALDDGERVLVRLTGLFMDSDGQTDFTSRQRKAIAPAITWQPSDETTLTLLSSYQEDDFAGGFVNGLPAQGTVLTNPNGKLPVDFYQGDPNFNQWDRTQYSLGYQFEHRFNDTWEVRQNLRYRHNDLDLKAVYGSSLQADLRTLNRSAFSAVEHSDDFTLDNQAEAAFATGPLDHTVLVGLDYQRLSKDTLRGFAAAPTLDIFDPVYHQTIGDPPIYQDVDTLQNQVGIYAQDQVKFGGWILTLGGRHDWAESDTTNNLTGVTTERADTAFTGRLGLGYVFENGIAPYLSYSESFEPTSGVDFSGDPFDPTTGTQYELGVKFQPPGFNSFVTLSGFQLTQQNVLTADSQNPGFSVQTGEIRSRGIELEGVASLSPGLDVTAAYTFLDAEVTESNDGTVGNRPAAIPTHWASIWADYTLPAGGQFAGLGLGAGVRYVGSSYGDEANSFEVPGYTLLDAAVHYDLGGVTSDLDGWRLSVNASNLLDEEYATCNFSTRCYYGLGRSVIATLRIRW